VTQEGVSVSSNEGEVEDVAGGRRAEDGRRREVEGEEVKGVARGRAGEGGYRERRGNVFDGEAEGRRS
jgi:hypothetical protein